MFNNSSIRMYIALQFLNGKTICKSTIYSLISAYMYMLFPVQYIFEKLFHKRIIRLYVLFFSLIFVKNNLPKLFVVLNLLDKRYNALLSIKNRMFGSCTSSEWRKYANEYEATKKQMYGSSPGLYDKQLIIKKLNYWKINNHKDGQEKYIRDLMDNVRLDLSRNFGNLVKCKLHEHYFSVPTTIKSYIKLMKEQLNSILHNETLPETEKVSFFRETRHTFGRTALLLSGGSSLGIFHMGVIKGLFENHLLPRIIAGSSAGSIVASIISVRTDEELKDTFNHLENMDLAFFSEHKTVELLKNLLEKGHFYDDKHLINKLRSVLGEYTFKEAYERTGRILNITVSPVESNETPKVLNYLTSPNVIIWSAVAASSAMPGLFPSQIIYTKSVSGQVDEMDTHDLVDNFERRWQDGSLQLDLPINTLRELFNCNYFIVSQCNPHLLPLLNLKPILGSNIVKLIEYEIKYRCNQLHFALPQWLKRKLFINFFLQTWEGDITLQLPITFYNPKKLITNPDIKELLLAVKMGERKVWESMLDIECNCAIEIYLDECVKKICGGHGSWGAT